jgi:hypothetical protein
MSSFLMLCVERFCHRVIEADAGVPDRENDAVRQREGTEFMAGVLTAAVGVDDDVSDSGALSVDRHPQRVRDQARAHMTIHRPADDFPGIAVDNRREIGPPVPEVNIGDVGKPELVRTLGHDITSHEVNQAVTIRVIAHGGHLVRTRMNAGQARSTGQPADALGQVPADALGELSDEPIDAQRRSCSS